MAYYGEDSQLIGIVADKAALQAAFPLDAQRAMASRELLRLLRNQGMSDADIATLGTEALAHLKDAENFGTLAHFFAGFLAPEFQAIAKQYRERMTESLDGLPMDDDDPGGEELFSSTLPLG